MDKSTIIELAESEVFDAGEFDFNPALRNLNTLFSNEFSNECRPKITDLSEAITFYESLTDEQIERRYCIHYWEVCAIGVYDSLHSECQDFFYRSIDKRELARRELINVQLLLNDGKCQILPNKEYLLINEIPRMYEKLITGTWTDFFVAKELESYESAREEHGQKYWNSVIELKKNDEKNFDSNLMELIKDSIEKKDGSEYTDYFNSDWVTAMQIQGLIWYKDFLEKTIESGSPDSSSQWELIKKSESRVKTITMKKLRRTNDGYEAITKSFEGFVSQHQRSPLWTDLINYMVENPPKGINVSGKKKRNRVVELSIEGLEKPIDREAFKKRFERYFPKTDIKQDNR